jgi:nicotinamidase-related amidase
VTADAPLWPVAPPPARGAAALVVIDMQVDFCAPGGWVDQLGEDVANTRAAIAPVSAVLRGARALGVPVIHTREGHAPDLSDLPANKQWRTRAHGLGIGDAGAQGRILVRGEPGWQIVPELAPVAGEAVVDKPGKSAFHATALAEDLRRRGITHLAICGVTTDCCVQSTLRDGYEHGFHCTVLSDCCAAVEARNHAATLAILGAFGGRWGTVRTASAFLAGMELVHA